MGSSNSGAGDTWAWMTLKGNPCDNKKAPLLTLATVRSEQLSGLESRFGYLGFDDLIHVSWAMEPTYLVSCCCGNPNPERAPSLRKKERKKSTPKWEGNKKHKSGTAGGGGYGTDAGPSRRPFHAPGDASMRKNAGQNQPSRGSPLHVDVDNRS